MKTKTRKPPKVTLAYCEMLFKKHDVKGSPWQAEEDNTSSPQITPEYLVEVLKNSDENTYFHTSYDEDEWYDGDGDECEGRCFLLGSILDDRKRLKDLMKKEGTEDFQPPFYHTKAAADEDRDALNRIIREHFNVAPKERTPKHTPESFVNSILLDGSACCPMCGGKETELFSNFFDSRSVHVERHSCSECHAEWEEIYTIKTYRNLRIP